MLVVVNPPHTEGFSVDGNIPRFLFDQINARYSSEDIRVWNDDGEELIDPHTLDFYKKAMAEATPGKNLRFFREMTDMTQVQLAEKLGTTRQAVSNMEHDIRPISKKTAKELSRIFRVSADNFI